jgi:hypothetical protein
VPPGATPEYTDAEYTDPDYDADHDSDYGPEYGPESADPGAREFGRGDLDGREFDGRELGGREFGTRGLGEDRYLPGRRRTSAEPLAASWTPEPEAPRRRRRGVTGLMAAYGWRIYAIPVLVVLTALVVFRTADQGGGSADASGGNPAPSSVGALPPGPPAATEKPPAKVDISKVPTAVLPDGGPFTQKGAGTWKGVPGSTTKFGKGGRSYTYTVEIEDGINPAEYGGDPAAFAATVDGILDDPRSWTGVGDVTFQRVDPSQNPNPSFRVSLTTPETDHTLCGYDIQYEASCYDRVSGKVVINLARWVRGAKAWGSDMMGYRQYAINHEVGHALGNGHRGCDTNGGPAPVMMQQTFGVADDYVAQLNQVDPYNRNAVQADGKVCTPNAWPNPDGKPAG